MSATTAHTISQLRPFRATFGTAVDLELRGFSVAEYHRLIRDGYFAEDDHSFELLEGQIVRKMPRDPVHDAVIHQAFAALSARLPAGWHVRIQSAITLSRSEPEPDLAVVRGSPLDYEQHHPSVDDLAVVIEVANSSLNQDRGLKSQIYGSDAVPVYWILNLIDRRLEASADPSGPDPDPGFRQRQAYELSQTVAINVGENVVNVPVAELIPKPR